MLAITAVEGCADADRVTTNLENVVEILDPAKRPRLGAAVTAENAIAVDTRYLHGDDGLGNLFVGGSTHLNRVNSAKLIADLIRQNPGDITIVCLGPLTNVATAIARDPAIATMIDRLYIVGGSVNAIGNITPAAEFNMYFDAFSAREVFGSAITKTLIPLDLTKQVEFSLDFLDHIAQSSRASFLHRSIQTLFHNYRQHHGRETILLNDAVGFIAAMNDDMVTTIDLAGDVEVSGELTRGVTVFDRRDAREWRTNIDVGETIEVGKVKRTLLNLLK